MLDFLLQLIQAQSVSQMLMGGKNATISCQACGKPPFSATQLAALADGTNPGNTSTNMVVASAAKGATSANGASAVVDSSVKINAVLKTNLLDNVGLIKRMFGVEQQLRKTMEEREVRITKTLRCIHFSMDFCLKA